MSGKRRLYYFLVFITAMIWHILCAYLICRRYSGEWAAYVLEIYVSGFLAVGIEKFFYTQTYKSDSVISKGSTCFFAVACPAMIAAELCEWAFISSTYNRYIAVYCMLAAGTAAYRLIYWLIGLFFKNIYFRR